MKLLYLREVIISIGWSWFVYQSKHLDFFLQFLNLQHLFIFVVCIVRPSLVVWLAPYFSPPTMCTSQNLYSFANQRKLPTYCLHCLKSCQFFNLSKVFSVVPQSQTLKIVPLCIGQCSFICFFLANNSEGYLIFIFFICFLFYNYFLYKFLFRITRIMHSANTY